MRLLLPLADRPALGLWLATRLATVVLVVGAAGILGAEDGRGFAQWWDRWDTGHYEQVAIVWYSGQQPDGYPLEAFFPGFPAAMWLVSGFGLSLVAAGLVVSAVAGTAAVVALRRLGDLDGPVGTGDRAVVMLLASPFAFFLFAAYTEALFLAFALPAWLAARRGRWELAVMLAAGAATVRVNGLFLATALAVHFCATARGSQWRRLPLLAVPLIPPALFSLYLWWRTGDPLRWLTAQNEGWHRDFHWPWQTWDNTWALAFPAEGANDYWAWASRFDLLAVLIAVGLLGALLGARRWGEATWIGLSLLAMSTSTWFLSMNRATLLWWPLWIGLAVLAGRRRWAMWAYLSVSVPLLAAWTIGFAVEGRWAG